MVLSVASLGLTVAVSVTVSPAFKEAEVLFKVMLVTGVATTVIVQIAVLSPALAVMVAAPTFLAVTTPLFTVATVASEVVQVTVLSVASLGLTVAVSVTVSPAFKEAEVLFKVMLVTGVATTVIVQVAVLSPALAVMVAVPTFFAITTPLNTTATASSEDVQKTVLSVASSGLTLAIRVTVSPTFKDAEVLSIDIDVTDVASTNIAQDAVFSPAFAVMVAEPIFFAITTPLDTIAISSLEELQLKVLSVASLGLTVASKVIVSPTFKDADVLFSVTLETLITFALTVTTQVADLPPSSDITEIVAFPAFTAVTFPF